MESDTIHHQGIDIVRYFNQYDYTVIPNSEQRHNLSMASINVRAVKAYALDWALCVIFSCVFVIVDKMEPFHQRFSLQDKTIQYPFSEHERIPIWLAAIIDILAPFLIIITISLGIKRNLHDLHHAMLGLLLSTTLTLMLTDLFKSFAGRPRPDFIDRCNPLPGSVDASPFGLSNSSICQQTNNHIMRDGFKSFVSGHSSLSFSGLGFLSLYLAGKLHIFDNKGHVYKSFVVLFPLAVATYIAITRIQDYRHHWQDVVSGGLIGFILSLFAYHQYYPHLNSYMSHRPLSIRINPPTSDHKATFTFNDGSTFEINVVRKDNTSPLNGVKTIELIKNDISDTQNHNEDNSQIV